jgi:hypothetical protein
MYADNATPLLRTVSFTDAQRSGSLMCQTQFFPALNGVTPIHSP